MWSTAVVGVRALERLLFAYTTESEGFYVTFPMSDSNIRLQTHHLKMVAERFLFLKTTGDIDASAKLPALKTHKGLCRLVPSLPSEVPYYPGAETGVFPLFAAAPPPWWALLPCTRKLLRTVTEPKRNWINMKVPLERATEEKHVNTNQFQIIIIIEIRVTQKMGFVLIKW